VVVDRLGLPGPGLQCRPLVLPEGDIDLATANTLGLQFLTGYLIEKALAVDNIFVFLLIMSYFSVPEIQRQRVLIIGIIGAIFLRTIMIFAGAAWSMSSTGSCTCSAPSCCSPAGRCGRPMAKNRI
jgi:Membrane protein TerC, possibly involved in tellurium resistance